MRDGLSEIARAIRIIELEIWHLRWDIAHRGTQSGTSVAPEAVGPKNTGSKPEVDQ